MKWRNFIAVLRDCIAMHRWSKRTLLVNMPPSPQPSPARGRGGQTAVALLSAVFLASAALAQSPSDFTTRADVAAAPGASIVRAALPVASIAALRGANGGDLRVFNASGVSLPHA